MVHLISRSTIFDSVVEFSLVDICNISSVIVTAGTAGKGVPIDILRPLYFNTRPMA
jgi:hypothetical protein